MKNNCTKCKDGLCLDGNASGHAGERYYPCSCDKGLKILIKDVTENDGYYGQSLERAINRLKKEKDELKRIVSLIHQDIKNDPLSTQFFSLVLLDEIKKVSE